MSINALLLSCQDRFQNTFGLTSSNVGIQIDGKPPPFGGELYLALHQQGFQNNDRIGQSLDETYGFNLTITLRTGAIPLDRVNAELLTKLVTGLNAKVDMARVAIHMNYDPILKDTGGAYGTGAGQVWAGGKAWSLLPTVNGFVEPLRFYNATAPQWKYADWFWAVEEQGDSMVRMPCGLVVTLSFGGARRVQTIESQT